MKKTVTILGFIFAIIAIILAVLPVFKFAIAPAVLAFIFSIIAFLKARKEQTTTQFIQLSLLLTIIALTLCIYKSIFTNNEVGNTDQLEKRENLIKEEAKEELNDLDIDDLDIEDLN